MDAPMTMNRVIHAAVRRDLSRLERALDGTSRHDRERADELRRAYANLRRELTHHHEQEDELIFPMLAGFGVDSTLLGEMDAEHGAMSEALADTAAAMDRYAASGSAEDAEAARVSVVRTQTVVDRHLDHEEKELEPLMGPHMESAEWKAVEKKLRSQPPTVAGGFFAWVQDGMGPAEHVYLTSAVPTPVRAILGKVFGRRYHKEIAPVWRS